MKIQMKRCSLIAATSLIFSAAVYAQSSTPAGPWITPNQNVSLEGFESYMQLVDKLFDIERRARGVVEIEIVGTTGEQRDVHLVKIGDRNKTPVMFITQQHGNEPHGTEAALEVIKKLASNGSFAKKVLGELYVLIIPRVNPDGSELFTRGNTDFDAPPRNSRDCFDDFGNVDLNQLDEGRGVFSTTYVAPDGTRLPNYDINRYHWPDWSQSWQIVCNPGLGGRHYDPDVNPVPEALAVRKAYDDSQPIYVIDIHNQGSAKIAEDVDPATGHRPNRLITGSTLWPTNEGVHEQARDLSKKITLVIAKRALELGNMEISNYLFLRSDGSAARGGGFAGIARNAYGLLGTERIIAGEQGPVGGSVLVEIRGQGQKSIGMLKNNAREIIEAVLMATADGSLFTQNPAETDTLLPPGNETDVFIGNPRSGEEQEEDSEPE